LFEGRQFFALFQRTLLNEVDKQRSVRRQTLLPHVYLTHWGKHPHFDWFRTAATTQGLVASAMRCTVPLPTPQARATARANRA
jgi:hypothetical protein